MMPLTTSGAPRTMLVTGASRGIGRACAIALAAPGVSLALLSRSVESLDDVVRACQDKGATVYPFGFDLAATEAIEQRMGEIKAVCGPIHTLVNNAGVWLEQPFLTGDMKAWDVALDINLKSVMHLTRYALEGMPAGGAVVFIASTASRRTYANGTNYCAGKHGLMGFAGALFEDVRDMGIKVCSILPGVVNTDMHANDPRLVPEKMIQPEDVAAAVAFVLSTPSNVCPTELVLQPQRYPKGRA